MAWISLDKQSLMLHESGLTLIRDFIKFVYCSAPGQIKLKADRPHPRDNPQMSTDYRHTDNHLRLVMVVVPQESAHRQTNKRADGWMLPSTLSPGFAVGR